MKTATKFFKRATKWYFKNAAKYYSWTPTGCIPLTRTK